MNFYRLAAFLAGLILLVACQAAGGDADLTTPIGEDELAPPVDGVLATPVDPIDITVELDETSAVEGVIPIEGGELTATGADGTLFTLEIPGDALLAETRITMTPVETLNGMPFGEGQWAVQLSPEGLFFNNFVTLTISTQEAIPLEEQLFFGYQEDGKSLFLATPALDPTEMAIQLLHFSGYGITKGLLADIEPVRARLGGDVEARLSSAAAEAISRARQEGGEMDVSELENLFGQYEEIIRLRVAAAGESCAAGRLALETVIAWERQKQLLGMSTEDMQLGDLLITVMRVCLQEEYELCRDQHIIHRMIPVWLSMERQLQLLGAGDESGDSAISAEARRLTDLCLRFELEFESIASLSKNDPALLGWESEMHSTVPIRLLEVGLAVPLTGVGPMENVRLEGWDPDCSISPNPGGGSLSVLEMIWEVEFRDKDDQLGYVEDFFLAWSPVPLPSDSMTITCEDFSETIGPSQWWTAALLARFAEGTYAGGPRIEDMDWQILGGELYATKEWNYQDPSTGALETGSFELYHRPGE